MLAEELARAEVAVSELEARKVEVEGQLEEAAKKVRAPWVPAGPGCWQWRLGLGAGWA